jgi:hypothetical protein
MVAMIYTTMDALLMTLTLARTSKRSRHARNNRSNIVGPGRTPYTVFYLSPRTRPQPHTAGAPRNHLIPCLHNTTTRNLSQKIRE